MLSAAASPVSIAPSIKPCQSARCSPAKSTFAVRTLQNRAYAEPLAGFVKCVRTVSEFVALPCVGGDAAGESGRVFIKVREVVRNYAHPPLVVLRGENVGLFADGIRRQNALTARLILRAVKIVMRGYVRHHRKIFVLPKPFIEQNAVLADASICQFFGGLGLGGGQRRIELDL